MTRYANDLLLTDLARRISNEHAALQTLLTNGHLGVAFLRALDMQKNLNGLMERMNDLKYRP
jgi:hypothetical protein